ncbi:MAG: DUF1273 domain-containing protein [Ruminococcaceae bacterium]|nr:DUF1273 domain-containing protein [Oscillospiraceae bacterium]
MNYKSICFTGHRSIKETAELKKRLYDTLEALIVQGAVNFYAGGAYGWDMLCELTVITLQKVYPHIKLHLVLPCSEQEQTAKWQEKQREQYYNVLNAADSVEYIAEHYFKGCMKERNARMVELADCCICYYKETDRASGTGQTVRMAQRKGIRVINFA